MTRILVAGDAGQTGFGTVTRDLGRAMIAGGDDLRFLSFNEEAVDGDLPEPFAGRTLTVGAKGGWLGFAGSDEEAVEIVKRITAMFTADAWPDGWSPEAVIAIGDAASFLSSPVAMFLPDHVPGFHYVPIEGVDLPPRWALAWQKFRPVAMSEFGADQIATIWKERPPVVYHGVDTEAFYPVSQTRPITFTDARGMSILRSKDDCKRFFGRDPREIWLFRADRHVPRKRYPSMLRSLMPVLAKHEWARLVLHCRTNDQGGSLDDEKSKYHPELQAKVIMTGFHDSHLNAPREILNALYNAADIYVSTGAEGFGLTIAEAMAAGTPAVGLHFSSVPEVIGNLTGQPGDGQGGVTVPVGMLMENIYSHFWAGVDEEAFAVAVDRLIVKPKRRRELGFLAPIHVARTFTWENAARQFSELARDAVNVPVAA